MATNTTTTNHTSHNGESLIEKASKFDEMSIVQQAAWLQKMEDRGYSQVEICKMVHKSKARISNLFAFAKLPQELKLLVEEDKVSASLIHEIKVELGMSDTEIFKVLQKVLARKELKNQERVNAAKAAGQQAPRVETKITRRDFDAFRKIQNSLHIFSKKFATLPLKEVKDHRATFEVLKAVAEGRFGEKEFKRLFLLTAAEKKSA